MKARSVSWKITSIKSMCVNEIYFYKIYSLFKA
jgi:hypothetical protein